MKAKATEYIGWYGAIAIIVAYALVSANVIAPDSWVYQLLNLTGAIGIVMISVRKKAKQPAILNIFWAIIAFAAIVHLTLN